MKNVEITYNAVEHCAQKFFDYVVKHPETYDHLGTILGYLYEYTLLLICGADIEVYKEKHKHHVKYLETVHKDVLRWETDEQRNCDA